MVWWKKALVLFTIALALAGVILAARWAGEKIREKLYPPARVYQTGDLVTHSSNLVADSKKTGKESTYSAIPKTGPASAGLAMAIISLLGGASSLALARRSS